MRKEILLALAAFFFMSLHALAGAFTEQPLLSEAEGSPGTEQTIDSKKMDVTGDGKQDLIQLEGSPYEQGSPFYTNVYLAVETKKGAFRVAIDDGYEPTFVLFDANHDGVKDIFVTINTGGSGATVNNRLVTFAGDKQNQLGVPKPLPVTGAFQDSYQIEVTLGGNGKTYMVNVQDRKADYDRLGLYVNGKVKEGTGIMVDPYSILEPIAVEGKDGFGLKGVQRISGAYHADGIGDVTSVWYYENGKWQLVSSHFEELTS
ncbi:hypothetical protein [Bacillus fonticola]|uniref:hypothetical protein n=1 Tax=Bacillus fonticola TaxID=2728853 RepID=UPI001475DD44|nr:hypothetical protein [Bacillus fonticola]